MAVFGLPRPAQPNPPIALALVLLGASLAAPPAAWSDDAATSWSAGANNAGFRWTYGWAPGLTGTFSLFTVNGTDASGIQYWRANPNTGARASYNPTGIPKTVGTLVIPRNGFNLTPGTGSEYGIVRWTAPVSGRYTVRGRFIVRTAQGTNLDVAVRRGVEVLFSRYLSPWDNGGTAAMIATLDLVAGETLDFMAGNAGGYPQNNDIVGVDATVDWEPPALPGGAVILFAGTRYAVGRWTGNAAEGIAYDPVNLRLASNGQISDRCGNAVSDGPSGPGIAWDPVTLTFWDVTNDRVVRQWSPAGVLLDTLFTVPLTFSVPGTGADTLESVRGLAVDTDFVYFVDAGPAPGEIPSNAWFKFTRAGAPVKSSKSTDLLANLDADPDALVDDIVWVPPSAPRFGGRLLVALEHSGIQVLDTEGNYVARFRWSTQSLPPKSAIASYGRVSAFAGLAVDPVSGALYLADNDTGDAQVWVPLLANGAASYAVVPSGSPGLVRPHAGCPLAGWESPPPGATVLLGLAYRTADACVYACDYNTGDLYRFDPRNAHGERVAPTGVGAIWGLAYDPAGDMLYGGADLTLGERIAAIDPRTGETRLLPSPVGYNLLDLAWVPGEGKLYGVTDSSPIQLVKVDPTTGVGTVVGNTVYVRGLDYDPISLRLWGIDNSQNRLYSIDPANGNGTLLESLPVGIGSDGLAVVPVPPPSSTISVEQGAPTPREEELLALPNPSRGGFRIEYALARGTEAELRVFDVQGRALRRIARGWQPAGRHAVDWDGRDDAGQLLAAGVYFVRLETGATTRVARVVRVE